MSHTWFEEVKLLLFSLSLFFCWVNADLIIEGIYKTKRGELGEKFTSTLFIIVFGSFINTFVAYGANVIAKFLFPEPSTGRIDIVKDESLKNETDTMQMATPRFSNFAPPAIAQLISSYASSLSIQYIDVPTKILAKTLKPLPVMLMGVILGGNRHNFTRIGGVTLLVSGIGCFFALGFEQQKSGGPGSAATYLFGIGLACVSLFSDGTVGSLQETLIRKYKPTSHELMFNLNLWQCIIASIACFATGQFQVAIAFIGKYPEMLTEIGLLSVYSSVGQIFIFLMIQHFGPLTTSIVTTMRKFLTIVANTFYYGHVIGTSKWLCIALVLVGVVTERYGGHLEKQEKRKKLEDQKEKLQ